MEAVQEHWYRAVESRDNRFDGWIYLGVTSTGVYCRPSCPALNPKRSNMRFYRSSAAAQRAGFRACKRCRPDASPGSPEWNARADVVARAVRLIGDAEARDRYGRLLAYVYRAGDGLFVNAALVRGGYARTLTIPPNVAHAGQLAALADEARRAGRGLWSACSR